MNTKDYRFSVRLDPEQQAQLRALATRRGTSPSGVLRFLIAEATGQNQPQNGAAGGQGVQDGR